MKWVLKCKQCSKNLPLFDWCTECKSTGKKVYL